MENDKQIQNEDEISLFDLFTVMLRYRKLIISITVLSVALAVAGYIFYPVYQFKKTVDSHQYLTKAIFSVKQQAQPYITVNLENVITNPEFVFDSLRQAGMETFGGISLTDENSRPRALKLIDNSLLGSSLQITSFEVKPTFEFKTTVEVSFITDNFELAKIFIPSLFDVCNENFKNYIRSDAEAMVVNYENLIKSSEASPAAQQILTENFINYIFFKDVLDGKDTVLAQIGMQIIDESAARSLNAYRYNFLLKAVIIVFLGMFFSIIITFGFNAIRSIKNDEEAMKKVRDALGNKDGK